MLRGGGIEHLLCFACHLWTRAIAAYDRNFVRISHEFILT